VNSRFLRLRVLFCCLVLGAAAAVWAETPNDGGPPGGKPSGPPPEAVNACKGKSEGDSVSFSFRDGHQVTGVCHTDNGVLAARPSGPGPGGHP
jgi:hypothetical protein